MMELVKQQVVKEALINAVQPPGPQSWGEFKNRGHPCPTPAGASPAPLVQRVIY